MFTQSSYKNIRKEEIEELYFNWLSKKLGPIRDKNPHHSHHILMEQMHSKEFVWKIPNDSNRAEDGIALRDDFADTTKWGDTRVIRDLPCSFLEMIIALGERASFMDIRKRSPDWWTWKMLNNAGLKKYTDDVYLDSDFAEQEVNSRLDSIIFRTYDRNGDQSLFPMNSVPRNFRNLELWYQLSHYITEKTNLDN